MLSLIAKEPLWIGTGLIDDDLAFKIDGIQAVWTANGGYWSLSFQLRGNQDIVEDWLENGLGRDITLYSPALLPIWEGAVNQASGNIGSLALGRGPLLDAPNKIKAIYSTVDTNVTPPAVGVREPTAWASNTAAQAKYSIIERVLSLAGATATSAAQIRDTRLADLALPKSTETDNLGSPTETSVTVECAGYIHWLKAYVYNSTTTGQQNASTKLQAVLAADPNSIFSTDYANITTNTTQVGAWENDDRQAWSIAQAISALGDASDNRYVLGVYRGRKVHYNAVPTTPKFQRTLADPGQWLELFGSGGSLDPWAVEPGQWTFYTDLFTGRTQPTTLRLDPRYLFIEQGTFNAPWALTMQGGEVNRGDQLLASLGLGGSAA
ncbi:MAG: hypothetical protein GY832_25960 [Chloroflexi bacterium]|nr:hypothetical protein [Chloroflexota bacterium]